MNEKEIEAAVKRIDGVRERKRLYTAKAYDEKLKELEDDIKRLKQGKQRHLVGKMKI